MSDKTPIEVQVDPSLSPYVLVKRIRAICLRHGLRFAYEPTPGPSPFTWRVQVTNNGSPVIGIAVHRAGELLDATREVYRQFAVWGVA